MSIASETSRLSYNGDGSTTEFSVTFYFLNDADLRVIVRDSDGNETVQTLNSDYTVSGAGDESGGSVTFTSAPASGETVTIIRDSQFTQTLSFSKNDPFPAASHERGLDKLTMISQRLSEKIGRAPLLPESSTVRDPVLPEYDEGKFLRWSSEDGVLEGVSEISVARSEVHFDTRTDVASSDVPSSANWLRIAGYSDSGDGGAALYKRAGSEPSHNGKIQSNDGAWWEIASPILRLEMFGVTYGATNENTEFFRALTTAAQLGRKLYGRAGETVRMGQVTIDAPGLALDIESDGADPVRILSDTSTSGQAIRVRGEKVTDTTLTANAAAGSRFVTVADATGIEAGHLLMLMSNKAWYHDPRAPVGWSDFNIGQSQGGGTGSMILEEDFDPDPGDVVGRSFTFLDGANRGFARTVSSYSESTKTVFFSPDVPNVIGEDHRYLFPAAQKGEMHEVVAVDGSTLGLRHPLGDGYDVVDDTHGDGKEAVSIDIFNPAVVTMRRVEFDWTRPTSSAHRSMQLQYCKDCTLDDVTCRNTQQVGFMIKHSYNVQIFRPKVYGANDTFTAYGVSGQASSFVYVNGGKFWGVRRGIDWHSTFQWEEDFPSWFCKAEDCDTWGGGERGDGTPWGPNGQSSGGDDAWNYGYGTHGPSAGDEWIDCRAHDVHAGFLLRSRHARIVNPVITGRCDVMFKVWFGGEHQIINPKYRNVVLQGSDPLSDYMAEYRNFDSLPGDDFRSNFPRECVELAGSGSVAEDTVSLARRGRLRIVNPDVVVRRQFFRHAWGGGDELADIDVEGGRVVIWPETSAQEVFVLNTNHSGALRRVRFNTTVEVRDGDYEPIRPANLSETEDCFFDFGAPKVFSRSQLSFPSTNSTSEETLASILIPAHSMGRNGIIRVSLLWRKVGSAGTAGMVVRFGDEETGSAYLDAQLSASMQSASQIFDIRNMNLSNQVGPSGTNTTGLGASTDAFVTSSVDTAEDAMLHIRGLVADAGDELQLRGYTVEVIYVP